MTTSVHRLSLSLEDQTASRYLSVPFEVHGTTDLEVRLAFDERVATIDLGCQGPDGWRGWSGGARRRFAITPGAATPGYLPGPTEDGVWSVVLGLHRMPARPVEVVLEVSTPALGPVEVDPPAPAPPTGSRASARALPAPAGLTWYAGDFHAHTLHSDGDQSIDQLAARAAGRGLDFLAVTDHNTVSHHPHLPASGARYDICLVPGQEVTTHRGHANVFGDIGFVDFREPAAGWVQTTEERGGVMSVNHPLDADCAWLHPLPRIPLALEIWHISWFPQPTATFPWALWPLWGLEAVPIGGSDFHSPNQFFPPGTPTTWVAAEDRTPGAVLDAVRRGRTAISRFPDGPVLLRLGEDLMALEAEGTVLVDIEGRRRVVHSDREVFAASVHGPAAAGRGPYRLEAADRNILAITS